MKKIIRNIDEKKGIIQITTADERWYVRESRDLTTGLPSYDYVPSVTWISESYPKGVGFYKWLANQGWDEAEAIKVAAGDKGSKVHYALTDLLLNKEVRLDAKYLNPTSGLDEELTIEEYECLYTFQRWFKTVKPQILQNEIVVWGDGYAGTIDFVARINGELYIIDFKTGQSIWPSYELQLSAYKHAYEMENPMSVPKLAVLQLGYKRNKDGFKFTEIEDQYDLFVAAKRIWQKEHGNEAPSQKDYPLVLSLKEDEPTPAKRSIKNSKHQETNA